ncbi:MAG: cob(I)yrinic acid a,c-diamide adenosyltransferase [Actinomycetia bacterium]|nr:cob(I)yrinic acid a,c-diamide adenosyltransferase [Actinomycetes bacterium]
MVHLTRIYTRTGDAGTTRLVDNSQVPKTDLRVEAYGCVDELNSLLGVVIATGGLGKSVVDLLRVVQNELFDLGSDLATPLAAQPKWEPLRVLQSSVDRLEQWCDEHGSGLPELRSFVLPGGTTASAYLHLARTVCRRAERVAWAAAAEVGTDVGTDDQPGGVNPVALTYLNRLSDLLFILARSANRRDGDILWVPGGERVTTTAQQPYQDQA